MMSVSTSPASRPLSLIPGSLAFGPATTWWGMTAIIALVPAVMTIVLRFVVDDVTVAGIFDLAIFVGALVGVGALWLGTLIEALAAPDSLWAAASQTKLTFVLLIVLLALLGAVLYVAIARPALRAATQSEQETA